MFSETSVRTKTTRYEVPQGIYNVNIFPCRWIIWYWYYLLTPSCILSHKFVSGCHPRYMYPSNVDLYPDVNSSHLGHVICYSEECFNGIGADPLITDSPILHFHFYDILFLGALSRVDLANMGSAYNRNVLFWYLDRI
jgi:hypothetical protein